MTLPDFEDQDCVNCSIRFRVPMGFTENRRRDKRTFYCPNGHPMSYTESELDRVRRERDRLQQQMAYKDEAIARERGYREQTELSLRAAKGQITKLRKRVSAGVCPCCTRSFEDLRRHMKTKHPEYAESAVDIVGEPGR